MKRSTPLPELLAPAGSYEALRAAVDAGADAVYFGTRSCNARAFAQNFDGEELEEALAYCRLRGVRAHVTLNTLLAGQSIRTKTHDQERSTIANLQGQVRDLTATVQRKNREIASLKEAHDKRDSEQRVAIMNLQETVAELRERNAHLNAVLRQKDARIKELYDNIERLTSVNTQPAQMTTPLGMLPVDSRGMRRLADAYAQIANMYNRRSAEQSSAVEKNAALQKENDAYEALFRVLAETLREYDPKVKS